MKGCAWCVPEHQPFIEPCEHAYI